MRLCWTRQPLRKVLVLGVHLRTYLGYISSDCIFFPFSFSPVPPEKLVTNGVLVVILNYFSSMFILIFMLVMSGESGRRPNTSLQAGLKAGEMGGHTRAAVLLCCSLWEDVLGRSEHSQWRYPETCPPPAADSKPLDKA